MQRPQAGGGLEQDKFLVPRFGTHPEVAESQKQSLKHGVSGNVVEWWGGAVVSS